MQAKKKITIAGALIDQRFYNSDNSFFIGRIDTGENIYSIKGTLPNARMGLTYKLSGRWTTHPKYGKSFAFDSYSATLPANIDAVQNYLERAKWIGPKTAEIIIKKYSDEALLILKDFPARVAAEIPGLTPSRAQDVSGALKAIGHEESAQLALGELLDGLRVSKRVRAEILATYGTAAADKIRENPYALIEKFRGIGFLTADAIALRAGLPEDGKRRCVAAMMHVLKDAARAEGHTQLDVTILMARAIALTGQPERVLARHFMFATIDDGGGNQLLHVGPYAALPALRQAEEIIARGISTLLASRDIIPPGCLSQDKTKIAALKLADDQKNALQKIIESPVFILTGSPGTGKAQPLNAKILTLTGWQKMRTILPGQKIINSSGEISLVDGVYPQGIKSVYRVTFSDNSSTECCLDHFWTTTRRDKRTRKQSLGIKSKIFSNISLREIKKTLKTKYGESNHSIQMLKPIQFRQQQLSIDAYVLGAFLGDGCFGSHRCGISTPDIEIIQRICKELKKFSVVLTKISDCCDYWCKKINTGKTNLFYLEIKKLGLWGKRSYEKSIPKKYLFSPPLARLALLNGLMDTDGHRGKTYTEFSTSSKQLAIDVQFLVESFGGTAKITSKIPKYTYKKELLLGRTAYKIIINLPAPYNPFWLRRKHDTYKPNAKYFPRRIIRTIEYVGEKETQCISTTASDGLYVTDNCLLTHNTFVTRAIINSFSAAKIELAAPTGKAARRMTELSGRSARTIHRLLEPIFEHGKFHFGRGKNNPLDAELIIIDEVSMIDVMLMRSLVRAIKPGTRLIFVGDTNQLPPVGPGNVLRDLIDSQKIPTVELTEIKRQRPGNIILNCHAIKAGRMIRRDNARESDCMFAACASMQAVQATIIKLATKILPKEYDADPLRDIQIITPLRTKTALGCNEFNKTLREIYNPDGDDAGIENGFRLGDKVIQTKNDYKAGILNGDIGYVQDIDRREQTITVELESSGESVELKLFENDLDFAYAITCHKYQGSEAPIIIIPILPAFGGKILQRNWIYTAISRAQRLCILVGDWREIGRTIARVQQVRRVTALKELMKND